ncbi:hypothetical protein PFICI_14963 [Pestalotiopsis fici W106-1]|uniref:Uncharacterized protein n=1 Tax=Pestalotiopsis fici (strain W106-1 / CGMCC3.15140) TaxID=1229662 RepID=W3WHI7_PESFW|nr:uncharacterized protein PFICI_14963 [Pestalotiopsis fici W106-1]ETS73358.1 hypothetical protein PFICI_14963 [Pestalotiopsis fici W106-1]
MIDPVVLEPSQTDLEKGPDEEPSRLDADGVLQLIQSRPESITGNGQTELQSHQSIENIRPMSATFASFEPPVDLDLDDRWVFQHHKYGGLIWGIERKKEHALVQWFRSLCASGQVAAKSETDYTRPDSDHSFRVSLAEMQRIHLRKLQFKLVQHATKMRYRDYEPKDWEGDLKSYIDAMKDYDYMIERSKSLRDPFLVTGERNIDDFVIRTVFDRMDIDPGEFKSPISVSGPWEEDTAPIGGTRIASVSQTRLEATRDKIFMAITGEKGKDVMSATAAYAAVLVVFVDLNPQGPSATL